ncbi:DNA translocase FtsK [Bacillus sp. AFS041924]|uniref:DNA translocase FtsK n=1 Tax=Bacillus sp. AFS041924 TaxID=2033503 RepID=UPI000BFCC34A|nr:DNA translocase FtsK [Bacillus sp. AFS041924]PGS56360.1 cell division protein FtsK [Bacillus sp. AFS041924]
MKNWLKSLFKANSLKEIEEEYEETPVEEKVYQSHSIEKKRNAILERPKFRFPIELDEELPKSKTIVETKDEPVVQQVKHDDFWGKSPNKINKEYKQPTYNQSNIFRSSDFQSNNLESSKIQSNNFQTSKFQSNQYDRSNLSTRLEKNEITNNEEDTTKVEKEEKVDIVFRPKRKTPFRPSEYISPIYGYQKPQTKEEQDTVNETSPIIEENVQTNNVFDSLNKYDAIDESSIVSFHDRKLETLNLVEKEEIQIELEDEVKAEEEQLEASQIEVKDEVKNEEEQPEASQIEVKDEVKNEEEQPEASQIEEVEEVKTEEEQPEAPQNELEDEVKYEEEQPETTQIVVEDEIKSEVVQIDDDETNGNYINEIIQDTKEHAIESEINEDSKVVLKEHKEESVQHETLTVQSNVEETVERNKDSVTNSNDKLKSENETNKEEVEHKPVEKRQKKRHFPFNVMMLRSDVEASRKANIMRQLRELQKESAATIEKVSEEVDSKSNKQLMENASSVEQNEVLSSENKVQSTEVIEPNDEDTPKKTQVQPVYETERSEAKTTITCASVNQGHEGSSEQSEVISLENKVHLTEVIEITPKEVQVQPVLETERSETETNITEATVKIEVNEGTVDEVVTIPPVLYELPELDLLVEPPVEEFSDGDWVEGQKQLLQETLHNFNVGARVIAATQGPTVTRFEVQPDPGVKVNKITNLQDDIKLSLAARDIRIEAPIPGRSAIGIEVPNKESKPVYLRELVSQEKFLQSESPLTVALGLDIGGDPVYADIAKMPHGLIAGATGSGKSVCINSILVSILYKAKPHEVKLILIDPKMVELAPYNHIPHLISPVITDARAATAALKWACDEMDRRYDLFAHAGARDIKRFNDLAKKKGAYNDELPYLVIIIDELADLMMVSPGDVETYICRIAQKARACGIHLLVATQRPSVDVITGIIKSNIPTRIAFTVSSQVDSRTIIDIGGAEKLLGRGDMLFLDNGKSQAIRLQGVYVSDDEIEHVVEIVKDQQKPNYLFNQEELVAKADAQDVDDELFEEAVEFVIDQKGASVSMLQRRFRIGYNRAARLVDLMFDHGIVSNQNGSKPRDVLITLEEFRSLVIN